MKHTPGPWEETQLPINWRTTKKHRRVIVADGQDGELLILTEVNYVYTGPHRGQGEAIAQIMEASQDLLAACQAYLDAEQELGRGLGIPYDALRRASEMARAAVEKATGENSEQ